MLALPVVTLYIIVTKQGIYSDCYTKTVVMNGSRGLRMSETTFISRVDQRLPTVTKQSTYND